MKTDYVVSNKLIKVIIELNYGGNMFYKRFFMWWLGFSDIHDINLSE